MSSTLSQGTHEHSSDLLNLSSDENSFASADSLHLDDGNPEENIVENTDSIATSNNIPHIDFVVRRLPLNDATSSMPEILFSGRQISVTPNEQNQATTSGSLRADRVESRVNIADKNSISAPCIPTQVRRRDQAENPSISEIRNIEQGTSLNLNDQIQTNMNDQIQTNNSLTANLTITLPESSTENGANFRERKSVPYLLNSSASDSGMQMSSTHDTGVPSITGTQTTEQEASLFSSDYNDGAPSSNNCKRKSFDSCDDLEEMLPSIPSKRVDLQKSNLSNQSHQQFCPISVSNTTSRKVQPQQKNTSCAQVNDAPLKLTDEDTQQNYGKYSVPESASWPKTGVPSITGTQTTEQEASLFSSDYNDGAPSSNNCKRKSFDSCDDLEEMLPSIPSKRVDLQKSNLSNQSHQQFCPISVSNTTSRKVQPQQKNTSCAQVNDAPLKLTDEDTQQNYGKYSVPESASWPKTGVPSITGTQTTEQEASLFSSDYNDGAPSSNNCKRKSFDSCDDLEEMLPSIPSKRVDLQKSNLSNQSHQQFCPISVSNTTSKKVQPQQKITSCAQVNDAPLKLTDEDTQQNYGKYSVPESASWPKTGVPSITGTQTTEQEASLFSSDYNDGAPSSNNCKRKSFDSCDDLEEMLPSIPSKRVDLQKSNLSNQSHQQFCPISVSNTTSRKVQPQQKNTSCAQVNEAPLKLTDEDTQQNYGKYSVPESASWPKTISLGFRTIPFIILASKFYYSHFSIMKSRISVSAYEIGRY